MKHQLSGFALFALTGLCSTASAQSDFYRLVTAPNKLEGGIAGAAVIAGREYQGSDESRVRVLPSVEYQWSNGFFAGVLNGVGYNASKRPDMAYGVRLTADYGRKEKRSTALRGLGDIDARPEVGAFFNFNPTQNWSLNSSLRYGSGNERDGLLVDLAAGWSTSVSPSMRLGATLATTWTNGNYAQSYFGINADQSARSGYALFTPDSGLRDVRVGLSLVYRLNPSWTLTGTVSRSELLGDYKLSPIVREKGTTSLVFAAGYSF